MILFLGFFVLVEIAIRFALFISLNNYFNVNIPSPYRENMKQVHLAPIMESSWCRFDPVCYYIPKDGFFRGPGGQFDIPLQKQRGEVRILCLGDSTTYGDAVNFNESWPAVLNRLLNDRYPHTTITVLNAGIPGASSRQVKRVFQQYLTKYNADIVIWRKGTWLTDSLEINVTSGKVRLLLWRGLYELRLFRVLCLFIDRGKDWKWTTADKIHDYITKRDIPETGNGQFQSDLEIVKKIAKDNNVSYVLALDYIHKQQNGSLTSDYSLFQEKGLGPVVSTLESFKEKTKTTPLENIFVDDCHMTETGTHIIAHKVYDFLVEKDWVGVLSREKNQ